MNFVTRLVPLDAEGNELLDAAIVQPGSLDLITPVPVPFSFDPLPETPLIEGEVGDFLANWHVDKSDTERNFFSLGGLTQVAHGGRPTFDANGISSTKGGASSSAQAVPVDLSDEFNSNGVPDYYENTLTSAGNAADGARGTAIVYSSATGAIDVVAPEGAGVVAVDVASATGVFTGESALSSLDADSSAVGIERDTDVNIFRISFEEGLDGLGLGAVAETGLTEDFILGDVTVRVLFDDGHSYGLLELTYE